MAGSKGNAMNMIHLLERMAEPLGFGVRGGGGGQGDSLIYYYYDDKAMMDTMIDSNSMKSTVTVVRSRMAAAKDQGMNVQMIPVPPRPALMPDLKIINQLCPKNVNFCYFLPPHRQAFSILKEVFMAQGNVDEVYKMACHCRDSPMVNTQLFVYAFCSTLVSRPDTTHIQVPNHVEISPDSYCGTDVVRQAIKMAHMPDMAVGSRSNNQKMMETPVVPKIIIDKNVTGRGKDPEQRMWYFREDILVNSHHFHWHIVFPACSPKDPRKPGYRDRRGELFYYMHHSMISRYDTERLCNGLPRTRKIDLTNLTVEEGYFGKLSNENSGMQWGTRQAGTKIGDVINDIFLIRVEDLTRWRDRILESIDLGYYVQRDPKTGKEGRVVLDEVKGIDVLGDIVENSTSLSPHLQYYGPQGFHNMGHVLVAFSNDPKGKFNEGPGPMGDVATAMRDPAFYRWHKYIDHIFNLYKTTLNPYELEKGKFPLRWKGIEVVPNSFYVKAYDSQERNLLQTFWDYKDVDLSRGLDFRKNINEGMKRSPVIGRFTHLNHGPFDYFLQVENKTGRPVRGTVRIFMAPRFDEHGNPFRFGDQRLLFFEMDKQARDLKPGVNEIRVSSKDSSVTLRDENGSSFKRIEEVHKEKMSREDAAGQSQCSCGWPQHLLLPRGSEGGTEYDLFVIVTDGQIDQVPDVERMKGCNSALSFCGVLNKKYPDARPMGFPFDRKPYMVKPMMGPGDWTEQCPESAVPVPDLERYVGDIKNSGKVVVTIRHDNMMKPQNEMEMEEQVVMPNGKCVQLNDYYNKNRGKGSGGGGGMGGGGTNWGHGNLANQGQGNRPGWGSQGNKGRGPPRPQSPAGISQQQWGGVGAFSYRKGRDYSSEDEFEHLSEEY